MKIINIEQGTQEWLDFREGRIGASECPAIMNKNPYKSAEQLFKDKKTGKKAYVTRAMERGTSLEPRARKAYEEAIGKTLNPMVIQHDEREWMIASLDGYNEDGTVIEIKCPSQEVFEQIQAGSIPEMYIWQAQHQMAVSGACKVILVAFDGEMTTDQAILRDEKKIEALMDAELKFFKRLMFEDISDTVQIREDDAWKGEADEWIINQQLIDEMILEQEERRKRIIASCDGKTTKGCGLEVIRVVEKGRVDYKNIPVLKTLDLDAFRGKPIEKWQFRRT